MLVRQSHGPAPYLRQVTFGVPLVDLGTIRLPRLIGLANRIAPSGQALDTAIALAKQIAAFPQSCVRKRFCQWRGRDGKF